MSLQRVVLVIVIIVPIIAILLCRTSYSVKNGNKKGHTIAPVPVQQSPSEDQQSLPASSQASELGCRLPVGGYKGWKEGVVTVMKPVIKRNCTKLFAGDEAETGKIKEMYSKWKNELTDDVLLIRTQNCTWLKDTFTANLYNTVLEQSFPLAFTFLIHNQPQQIIRLLKLLYRPQNVYCLHYDLKSKPTFKKIFDNLAQCFDNIFIASTIIKVEWGASTILASQMTCLYDLMNYRESKQTSTTSWRYVINLCGKELPLLSSREIVSRLIALNGSSSLEPKLQARNSQSWKRLRSALNKRNITTNTLPYNLTLFKSSSYNAISYQFAQYLAFDPMALSVREFFKECYHSEEHYYATLYMQPGIPGGFDPTITSDKYFRVEIATWCYHESCKSSCHGKLVRSVCVCATGDLPQIESTYLTNGNLFHNKYAMDLDHTVMDCLEERAVKNNVQDYHEECIKS